MTEFTTVYEFSLSLMFLRLLGITIIPIVLLLFNIYVLKTINKKGEISNFINYFNITDSSSQKSVAKICITLLSILLLFLFYKVPQKNMKAYNVFYNQKANVVEGFIRDFEPMPKSGRKNEVFYVDSIKFAFSDYYIGGVGYNNAKSKGGFIDDSLYVRIHYYDFSGTNEILKLEIQKQIKNEIPQNR